MKYISILFFLALALNANCQSKSTIIIDSVLIIYNNDTLMFEDLNKVYFVCNDRSISLPIFKNDSLNIEFDFESSYYYKGTINRLFRAEEKIPEKSRNYIIEPCDFNIIEESPLNSFVYDTLIFEEKFCDLYYYKCLKTNYEETISLDLINKIEVNFRITPAVPVDTTLFDITRQRNNMWIGHDFQDTIKITYKNNLRNGNAYYCNSKGNYTLYLFENDIKKGDPVFYNKQGKSKGTKMMYMTPYQLTEMCPFKEKDNKK